MARTARRRPIRTHFYTPKGDYAPIAAITPPPFMDMMLVILIMLIVPIPMPSHKVPLELPPPDPGHTQPPPSHRLTIDSACALRRGGRPRPAPRAPYPAPAR